MITGVFTIFSFSMLLNRSIILEDSYNIMLSLDSPDFWRSLFMYLMKRRFLEKISHQSFVSSKKVLQSAHNSERKIWKLFLRNLHTYSWKPWKLASIIFIIINSGYLFAFSLQSNLLRWCEKYLLYHSAETCRKKTAIFMPFDFHCQRSRVRRYRTGKFIIINYFVCKTWYLC